jgi:hypothetical protein
MPAAIDREREFSVASHLIFSDVLVASYLFWVEFYYFIASIRGFPLQK